MSTEQVFLDALTANPGDDITRGIYADWLEDHDDWRCRYLRLELELAELADTDERQLPLEQELREARAGLSPDWLGVAGKRWDVWLLGYSPHLKIAVIKVIREVTGCGLKEAKDLSEAVPVVLTAGQVRHEAETIRGRLLSATQWSWTQQGPGRVDVSIRPAGSPVPRPFPARWPETPATGSGDVVLVSHPPDRKVAVIKAIREVTGLGLYESKVLAESPLPVTLAGGLSEADVARFRQAFTGIALIRVRPASGS